PKVVTNLSIAGGGLTRTKVAVSIVASSELLQFGDAGLDAFLAAELSAGLGNAADGEFVPTLLDAGTEIPSIGDMESDLAALAAAVLPRASSALVWIVSPRMAAQAAARSLRGLPGPLPIE